MYCIFVVVDSPGGGCNSGGPGRNAAATAACALKAAAYATRLAIDAGRGNWGVYADLGSLLSDKLSTLSPSLSKYRSLLSRLSDKPSSSWIAKGDLCGARGALAFALIACMLSEALSLVYRQLNFYITVMLLLLSFFSYQLFCHHNLFRSFCNFLKY